MDLSTILSISGKPGLYKLVSQTKNGALVESLADSRRYPAFANDKISSMFSCLKKTKVQIYGILGNRKAARVQKKLPNRNSRALL